MSTGIHTIGQEGVVSVRHRSVTYTEAAGRPATTFKAARPRTGRFKAGGHPVARNGSHRMRQDGRSGGRPARDTLAGGRPVVPIMPVVATAFPTLTARPERQRLRCCRPARQDDAKSMAWNLFNSSKDTTMTATERKEFERLDMMVAEGVRATKAVLDAGRALATIRDRQLYRDTTSSWEAYLETHGLSRRRADQLVAAATALDAAAEAVQSKTGTTVPGFDGITERTARQLVGMDADDAADAVIEAAGTTEGLTPKTLKAAAARRKKTKAPKVAKPRRFKVAGAIVQVVFNRKGTGSAIDALSAALRQAEADLERQAEAA